MIHLKEHMSWKEKKMAVETSLLLGFQSVSSRFPIASFTEGMEIPGTMEELRDLIVMKEKGKVPDDYAAASDYAKPIPAMDQRTKKGLELLFGKGWFLKDENHDQLPDRLDMRIVLSKSCCGATLMAACNMAFRFGMETTAYCGRLVAEDTETVGNAIVFEEGSSCGIRYEETKEGIKVIVSGKGKELEQFSAYVCENFPLISEFDTWKDTLQMMTDSFAMQNLDGQLAYLDACKAKQGEKIKVYVSPEIEKRKTILEQRFPEAEFYNYKGMKSVYEKQYEIPWEVDVFRETLKKHIYPRLKQGDRVELFGAVSEEKEQRDMLEKEIKKEITACGAVFGNVEILCAYKQGFSWVEERVLPKLKKTGMVEKVEIAFRPFLPDGVTAWTDEDGATPSYNNVGNDPDKWLDLPIRYLQELYPIEDIAARQLGIEREQIIFQACEETGDFTYRIKAYDKRGNELYQDQYKAVYSERSYIDAYPEMGKVHPATGYVKVLVNGERIWECSLLTDVERLWNIYQSEVLPNLRTFIEEKGKENLTVKKQPFFSQLRMDIRASEPDYKLPCREDLFSTLDALHEDMYFMGADYFKQWGMETTGEMLDAPGLILPVIKKGSGKPIFKVTLFDQNAAKPCILADGNDVEAGRAKEEIKVWIKEVQYIKEQLLVVVGVEGVEEAIVESYMKLLKQDILQITQNFGKAGTLKIETKEKTYTACLNQRTSPQKNVSIADVDIMEHTLIGYEQYMQIIEQLKQVPGLAVYRTAVSYTGREIYAVELLPNESGYVSRTKRITNFPSEIINARHHANEVSGTNAAFMLIKKLLTEDAYKEIADKLNLVIVPMENVDGAAIHYELQKENPHWKLHVARFNAIGKEFYHEHFKPDTIHTEAMGLTRLWETFLPDVIVDNHGVPSHEWEQQFSGYTSPSFKGFWLPRSILYGYFWTVSDEVYKGNYPVNKKMEDAIADAIAEDTELTAWNKEWSARFEKYAHAWMPKLFPANYYKDMINYWILFAHDMEHRYPSIRFPWITTVAYTSEVADETAQGEYLNLCARAHVTHDLAILAMLVDSKRMYIEQQNVSEDGLGISRIRQRPIVI